MDQMKRVMEEMKDSMRRANYVDDLVHRIDSPLLRPSQVIPYCPSSRCLPWIHMMERVTFAITLPRLKQPCILNVF